MNLRASLEPKLNRIWYRDRKPPWYLRLMTPVYRALLALDRHRQERRRAPDLAERCVVVVGNVTAGGSGKTPLVIRLCALFREAGLKTAVVSRGYGRDDRKQRLVVRDSNPSQVGDEPILIARRAGVPVMVGPDRAAAARALFARGADVVISDDGLQHHGLPRAFEICVIDGDRGLGNGYLLPAGPLREDPDRLARVDHVVINGAEGDAVPGSSALAGIDCAYMEFHPRKLESLCGEMSWRLAQFSGCRVVAVAAIGNPRRFFELLRQAHVEPVEKPFPDHHVFTDRDFADLPEGLPIIMTEKDAVKCRGLALKNAWYLTIDAQLPFEWERQLVREVRQFLNEH